MIRRQDVGGAMLFRWVAVLAVLLLAACGGGGGGEAAAPAAPTIGAQGGVVDGPDGSRAVIPADAVDGAVTIRIARDSLGAPPLPADTPLASPVYSLTPHGIALSRPARLRIPFDPALLQGGEPVLMKAQPGGAWQIQAAVERDGNALLVDAATFSYYVVRTCTSNGTNRCFDTQFPLVLSLVNPAPEVPAAGNRGVAVLQTAATLRAPRYIDLRVDYAAPTVDFGISYRLLLSVGGTTRVVDSGTLGTSPARLQVPITAQDNGTPVLSVEISCVTRTIVPLGSACSNFDSTRGATAPFVAVSNTLLLQVRIPPGASLSGLLPAIVSAPQDVEAFTGEASATFSASAATLDTRHYWQESRDGGTTWRELGSWPIKVERTGCSTVAGVQFGCSGERRVEADPAQDSRIDVATDLRQPLTPDRNGSLYRVRLQNTFGSVLSSAARLTVVAPDTPTLTQQPQSVAVSEGQTASFNAVAGGRPQPRVCWETRAQSTDNWVATGACGNSYTTGALAITANGQQVRARVSNVAGVAFSQPASIAVTRTPVPPSIVASPQTLSVAGGATALFAASANGTAPLSYQWLRDGAPITGANAPLLRLDAVPLTANGSRYRLRVTSPHGSTESADALLTVVPDTTTAAPTPPAIVTPPAAITAGEGQTAAFAVGASGSGPLGFQWLRNGTPIPGATAAVYGIASVAPGDAGSYSVTVTNPAGSVTSTPAALTVTAAVPPQAPTINAGPATVVVLPGSTTTLAVAASGSGPLDYQWQLQGVPIAGAKSALLTLTSITSAQAGSYTVTVSNSAGSVTSAAAQVLLVGAPEIKVAPAAVSAVAGTSASFQVVASGDSLRYQWTRNGVAIDGATSASYTTPTLALANSGAAYGVIVYNGAGLVITPGAVLTVTPPPNPPGMVLFAGDFSSAGTATGTGTAARFDNPVGLTADASGNLYVASSNGKFVSRIEPSAAVTHLFFAPIIATSFFANPALAPDGSLFVGSSSWCGLWRAAPPLTAPAPVVEITLANCPVFLSYGLSVDAQGRVAIADSSRHAIIRATQQPGGGWTQTYFAGATDYFGGDANRGSTDANGTAARFSGPAGLAYAANGDLFVAELDNGTIRRITPTGDVSTFAGAAGQQSTLDGTGTAARFHRPFALAFDPDGNLIVLQLGASDADAAWVRRITPAGVVTTLFDARAEAAALATDGNAVANARQVRGIVAPGSKRIALSAGNAVLVRTLP